MANTKYGFGDTLFDLKQAIRPCVWEVRMKRPAGMPASRWAKRVFFNKTTTTFAAARRAAQRAQDQGDFDVEVFQNCAGKKQRAMRCGFGIGRCMTEGEISAMFNRINQANEDFINYRK